MKPALVALIWAHSNELYTSMHQYLAARLITIQPAITVSKQTQNRTKVDWHTCTKKHHLECETGDSLADLMPNPSGKVEKFDITSTKIWAKLGTLFVLWGLFRRLPARV